ncbi:MAG TPA: tail fiber protein [Solirubrobacteraceae bacterium]|nr:tail fiber protein [Solirubrobacteraceae bacterium]
MAQPYIGEIRMFGGNFAPVGWMRCEGQVLPISQYDALFTLIGTTYGGDGQSTFALPDLRGRLPVHQSTAFIVGRTGGAEEVTLTLQQIPVHSHPVLAAQSPGSQNAPGGNLVAETVGSLRPYIEDAPSVNLAPAAIGPAGGSQPHTNLQPYQCISFIISLFGIFPSPT